MERVTRVDEDERSAGEVGLGTGSLADGDSAFASLLRGVARPEGGGVGLEAPPLPPGTVIAHYRVEALLGRGGMGVVYRARDASLGRVVALKVLVGAAGADTSHKRFLREARALAEVRHPHIAAVYAVGEAEGLPYIAMEYVEGRTLRRVIEEAPGGALPAVRGLLRQALEGVAAVHAAGLVHRDLKPENFMVTPAGAVKLLDFGLARRVDARAEAEERQGHTFHTEVGHVMGTAAYMSPEQAAGDAVDARSDVFSFGVMAYELLVGRRPFQGDSRRELIQAILAAPPPDPRRLQPQIGAGLARVLLRALAKRPEDRYLDCGALAAALDGLREDARSQARRRAAWGGVGIGVALVSAALAMREGADAASPSPSSAGTGNGGACTTGADCVSGRCTAGACRPWSVLLRGAGADSVNTLAVDPHDRSVVVGGYFRGALNLGCAPLTAGGLAPDGVGEMPLGIVARLRADGVCAWNFLLGERGVSSVVDDVQAIEGGHTLAAGFYEAKGIDLGAGPLPLSGRRSGVVVELDARGAPLWATAVDSADYASAEMVAPRGDAVFVAGGTVGATVAVGHLGLRPSPRGDAFVARLDRRGRAVWARALQLDAPGASEGIFGLTTGARGDVLMLGMFDGVLELDGVRLESRGARDTFLVALAGEDGRARWGRSWGTAVDEPYEGGFTVDASGALFVTGEHRGADLGGGPLAGSMFVAQLRGEDGAHVWSVGMGGGAPRDNLRRVEVDRAGDLVVAGRFFSPQLVLGDRTLTNLGGSDLLALRLSRDDGRVLGLATFPASDAPVRALAYDAASDNVIVGGRFDGFVDLGEGRVMVADQDGYVVSVGALD